MKALKLIIFGVVLFLSSTAQAQISVRLNIGTPPLWGPVGYSDVRYYYLPDVEAYYDVQASMFIYKVGGTWVHRRYLPSRYRGYDLYGGYKVVMNDYHGNRPYTHFTDYRHRYARGYRGEEQRSIGERPGRGNYNPRAVSNGRPEPRMNQGNYRNAGRDNGRNIGPGNNRSREHGNIQSVGRGNDRNVGQGNNRNAVRGNDKNNQKGGRENGKNK